MGKGIRSHLYAVLMIFLLWQLLHLLIGESMVPSCFQTIERFIFLLRGDLLFHLGYSLYRILVAIFMATLIGVPIGLAAGVNSTIDRLVFPIVYLLYPIPKVAFLPIFMVLFGIGDVSKIGLIVAILVFQMMIATRDGVLQLDESYYQVACLLNLNRLQWVKDVLLPGIAIPLFSALRVSLGIAISALFFSENYATRYGIGYFIMNAWSMVDYKDMFAGVVALSLLSFFLYKVIDGLQRLICPWFFKR